MATKKKATKPVEPPSEEESVEPTLFDYPVKLRLAWGELQDAALTVWGEARNQDEDGMLAVACVIVNRVIKSTWYGGSVNAVVHKRWQFSCWNEGDPNLQKMKNHRPVDSPEISVAIGAMLAACRYAGTDKDPSNGATHFHTKAIKPDWAKGKEPCAELGDHLFYNNID